MVQLSNLLKLGAFSEQIKLKVSQLTVQHFGFARKTLPPDTPHNDNKQRWAVNNFGQKVIDEGTPIEEIRTRWIAAVEKTYEIPEDFSIAQLEALVDERCDLIRTLCTLAEKGDEPSGDYLLKILAQDPAQAVRKTVLSKFMFAARGPQTPYHARMVEGTLVALADPVSDIRGMVVVVHERATREWDLGEVRAQLPPQKVKTVAARRGECEMPGAPAKSIYAKTGSKDSSGPWAQVRDLAMAMQDKDLLLGVVNMLRHPVLPVRIAAWETFGDKDKDGTTGRCLELEKRQYENSVKYEEMKLITQMLQREVQHALNALIEAKCDSITAMIKKERARHDITSAEVDKLISDFQEKVVADAKDDPYHRLKRKLDVQEANLADHLLIFTSDKERYTSIQQEVEAGIMGMIGNMLKEHCAILRAVNQLFGSDVKGNWYVRRCLVRILEPMAVAGNENAVQLLEKAKNDRSAYVRRTVKRSLKAVWLAERARTASVEISEKDLMNVMPVAEKEMTEAEKEAKELQEELKGLGGVDGVQDAVQEMTLEDKRKAIKCLKLQKAAAEEQQRIKDLYVPDFHWKKVLELFESLRPKYTTNTDGYIQQVKYYNYSGAAICNMLKDEVQLKKGLKMKILKHRVILKLHIKQMLDQYNYYMDVNINAQRMQQALEGAARETSKLNQEVARAKRAQSDDSAMKSATRFDNYAYGTSTGLGSVLVRDNHGNIIFRRVIPCGGLVNDGDTLLKVGTTPVQGLSLVDVKNMFLALGDMAPCLVRLTADAERGKELAKEHDIKNVQSAANPALTKKNKEHMLQGLEEHQDRDFLRTVRVTCQPPPLHDEYLEGSGLDVEVYKDDSTRTLQVMTFLQRNNFASLLKKCLVDLKITKLVQLAQHYKDEAWIRSLGMKKESEQKRFKKLLERLAFRYGIRDLAPEINTQDTRPDAHPGWVFIRGREIAARHDYPSKYRSHDETEDIDAFRKHGRTSILISSQFSGMEYTLCWHPELKIAVELMHTSAGTLRIALPRAKGNVLGRTSLLDQTSSDLDKERGLPGVSGAFDFYVVFSNGRMEPAVGLNAERLFMELATQPSSNAGADSVTIFSRPGTSSRPSTSKALEYDVLGRAPSGGAGNKLEMEIISEVASQAPAPPVQGHPGGQPVILASGANLGSSSWKRGFRFFVESPISAKSAVSKKLCTSHDASFEKGNMYSATRESVEEAPKSRSWYVKGAGRGPGKKQVRLLKFVKEGDKDVEAVGRCSLSDRPLNAGNEGLKRVLDGDTRNGTRNLMAVGKSMGWFGSSSKHGHEDDDSDAESDIDSDEEEEVVGYHTEPLVGYRVILRKKVKKRFPELLAETENTTGTITWVDPTDADGDGITGDISEVAWDSGYKGDYRTGFEGTYRLCLDPDEVDVNTRIRIGAEIDEKVVGLDVEPLEGQRVVFMTQAIRDNPSLYDDSKGGPGTIIWVDPEDADGDGVIGDICEVQWDLTGTRGDYRTGFEGAFRLAIYDPRQKVIQAPQQKEKPKSKSLGRKGLRTIDVGRPQPPDDPWKFWEENTDARGEKKVWPEEMPDVSSFEPKDYVSYKMTAAGPPSKVRAGNWIFKTHQHKNGTAIEVKYDPISKMLGDYNRHARDVKNLGLRSRNQQMLYMSEQTSHKTSVYKSNPLAVHLTGVGAVVISPEPRSKEDLLKYAQARIKPPTPGQATVIRLHSGQMITEDVDVEEAELVAEGIPRHVIVDVLSLKRNEIVETPAGKASEGTQGFDAPSSEPNSRAVSRHSSSRPGSKGHARMSHTSEMAVPQSIRSVKRNAAHERPITPITGKPYTSLQPSSRGSVRQSLNLEDTFAVGRDMLSRNAIVLQELHSKEGDFGRQARLASEANILIEDDNAR